MKYLLQIVVTIGTGIMASIRPIRYGIFMSWDSPLYCDTGYTMSSGLLGAIKRVNSTMFPVEFVWYDTKSNDNMMIDGLLEMVSIYNVDVIIGPVCSSAEAASLVSRGLNIPIVTYATSAIELTADSHNYRIIRAGLSVYWFVPACIAFLLKHEWNHVNIVYSSAGTGILIEVGTTLSREASAVGINVDSLALYQFNEDNYLENNGVRIFVLMTFCSENDDIFALAEAMNMRKGFMYITLCVSDYGPGTLSIRMSFPEPDNTEGLEDYNADKGSLRDEFLDLYTPGPGGSLVPGGASNEEDAPYSSLNIWNDTSSDMVLYDTILFVSKIFMTMTEDERSSPDPVLFSSIAIQTTFSGFTGNIVIDENTNTRVSEAFIVLGGDEDIYRFVRPTSLEKVGNMYPEWYEGEVVTNALVYFEYERESHCRSVDILWSLLVAATSIIVLCVLRAKELFSERPPTIKNVYIHKTGSKEMVVEKSSTLIIQTEIKRISARNSVYQGTFGKHKVVMKVLLSDEMGSTEMKVAELLPISSPYVIRHMFTMTTSTKILVVYGMKDRGDLASLTSGIGLSTVRAIKYIRDAEKGLKDLHDIGVIHGDIRAENLLLGQNYGDEEHGHGEHEDDVVSICDFDHSYIEGLKNGIKFMERRARREPNWLAPEIILDSSSIPTKKTDFYSLGATLYEIYTGKIPWKGKTYVDIVNIARDGRAILTGNVIIDEEINRFVNM